MTCFRNLLAVGVVVATLTAASGALALNPQPLPPRILPNASCHGHNYSLQSPGPVRPASQK